MSDDRDYRYSIAGKAAGEAALKYGAGRKATDAFVLSRIARAVVDALAADERQAIEDLRAFAQDVIDLPCAFGREGDPLAAQQRRAADLINAYRR